MKYWYWILGAVVLGGTGVFGYYYGPGWLDALTKDTHKNNEADINSSNGDTNSPSSNNWDYLIQAANAGRNAELTISVPMDSGPFFEVNFLNKYKISNVASNGDVTFEYKVLSLDMKLTDWAKQSMLDEGYTPPEDTKTVTEYLGEGSGEAPGPDRFIGYTQKSVFTKTSFISMIEDWKVGSFSIGNWGSFEDIGSLSPSPDYIKVFTVQCADNDWDCLIQAANVGNNARLLVSSRIEEDALESGLIYSSTNEYKISNVASNGDVDFGYMQISGDVKLSEQFKQDMVDKGTTETEIEQYVKELETSRGVGFGESSTFPKASFIALIKKWQSGSFSILDFSNYHTGDWGARSPSLDDADTPADTHSGQSPSERQSSSAQEFVMDGISMEPTISKGALLNVDASEQAIAGLRRGDIIKFLWPQNVAYWFVKRIVGMPGESIEIRSGSVFINGKKLSEPYLKAGETTLGDVTRSLGNNEYFVMGDNRHNSSDSRLWGPVGASYIRGKVVSWELSSPDNASTDHFIDGSMIGL